MENHSNNLLENDSSPKLLSMFPKKFDVTKFKKFSYCVEVFWNLHKLQISCIIKRNRFQEKNRKMIIIPILVFIRLASFFYNQSQPFYKLIICFN